MNGSTLVSTAELAANYQKWRVFDCRHDLADYDAGRRAYAEAHVPGARFVHLDEDLSGPKTGRNGRHPLPQPGPDLRQLRPPSRVKPDASTPFSGESL